MRLPARMTAIALWVRGAARSLLTNSLEPLRVVFVNRKLAAAPVDDVDIKALSDEDLKKLVESEWTRAKELDDKLQKLTAALTVSVAVGGLVASTILQDLALSRIKVASGVLFLLAAMFLFGGVLLGFNGLRPKPRYGYGAAFMRKVACTDGTVARDALIAAAAGFQRDNMIRANEASAATASIRNGIVIFVVAMLLGLIAAVAGKAPSAEDMPPGRSLNGPSHKLFVAGNTPINGLVALRVEVSI